uniref:Regulatory protein zeste n=1 Tax=Megaselia scalaris TaxID=36166 RepID=T1GG81_MEGSC
MKPEKDDSVGSAASGTPRFTHNEKTLLYKLFQANEDVIDIKYRKVSKQKMSVREAWEKIVNSYNTNPNITTKRNYKQIQKFWLNARKLHLFSGQDSCSRRSTCVQLKRHFIDFEQAYDTPKRDELRDFLQGNSFIYVNILLEMIMRAFNIINKNHSDEVIGRTYNISRAAG